MNLPIISDDVDIQAEYERMRGEGTAHTLAEMFALQRPPRANDDTTFLAARRPREQFAGTPHLGDFYAKEALAAGENITGAIYENGLARYPGDPMAWVRDRGEIAKKCELLNMNAEGAVNYTARNDLPPLEEIDIADDIVQRRAEHMVEQARAKGDTQAAVNEEVLHAAREQAKPHWSKT